MQPCRETLAKCHSILAEATSQLWEDKNRTGLRIPAADRTKGVGKQVLVFVSLKGTAFSSRLRAPNTGVFLLFVFVSASS